MSDVTTSAPQGQDQTTTPPAPDTAPAVVETAAPDTTTTPEPTADDAGDTATLAGANKTLRRFASLCRAATDHNYAQGETAALYVEQYLGASDKSTRSRAVENLAAEWLQWDEDSLSMPLAKATTRARERMQRLLRVHAVRVLLGDGRDVAKGDGTKDGRGKGKKGNPIPWAKLLALAPLVDRDPADNVESWAPLSDTVREKGTALVCEIAASGLNRKNVLDAVRRIAAEHYTARVVELKRIADAAPDDQDAARAVQRAEKVASEWVDKVADEQPAPAVESTDATEEDTTPEPTTTEPQPQPRAVPLTQMAKEGTAKDVAEMARELVESNDNPDEVLLTLLSALKGTNVLSKKSLRAVAAALDVLTAPAKAPAVSVAALNGHAAAVA